MAGRNRATSALPPAGTQARAGKRGSLGTSPPAPARSLAALVNPVLLDEEREPLKSVVALVVDKSQSQDIGGRAAHPTAGIRQQQRERGNSPGGLHLAKRGGR